jgi:hypothetical protein
MQLKEERKEGRKTEGAVKGGKPKDRRQARQRREVQSG